MQNLCILERVLHDKHAQVLHKEICAEPILIWPGFTQSGLHGFYTRNLCKTYANLTGFYIKYFTRVLQNRICAKPIQIWPVLHKVFYTGFTQQDKWMVPAKPVRNKLIKWTIPSVILHCSYMGTDYKIFHILVELVLILIPQ